MPRKFIILIWGVLLALSFTFVVHTPALAQEGIGDVTETIKTGLSLVPLWAYIVSGICILVLFSKKYRPLGYAGIGAILIVVFGFYFTIPASAQEPPQMIKLRPEDIIEVGEVIDYSEPTPAPTEIANATPVISSEGKPSKNPADYPLNSGPCEVSPKFPEPIYRWCGLITYYSNQRGLDPNLIAAVIFIESYGDPEACDQNKGHMVINGINICGSRDGAIGLMQVMPSDGISFEKYAHTHYFDDRPTSLELLFADFNVMYGTGMLMRGGAATNPRKALFHYGPAGDGYTYADTVLGIYNSYR